MKRDSQTPSRVMTHVVLGYPSLQESIDLVKLMEDCGVQSIELQIPFSDPMADGPTIMWANEQALKNGVTPPRCMAAAKKLSRSVQVPLYFMTYFNIVYAFGRGTGSGRQRSEWQGVAEFCKSAREAGVTGLIVPDLPIEEEQERFRSLSRQHQLVAIPLVSPLTSEERLQKIAKGMDQDRERGFVYCVSTTGTTGARQALASDLSHYLRSVRRHFSVPLAVGFGISKREHVRQICKYGDIAIVGSALIDVLMRSESKQRLKNVRRFLEKLLAR